jgi:hypothetical protein
MFTDDGDCSVGVCDADGISTSSWLMTAISNVNGFAADQHGRFLFTRLKPLETRVRRGT